MPTITPITRILIANRGEIASRVIRTARLLGISTVAVHSDPDAGAPYVREADLSVLLPGAASSQTYLDGALIIEAALSAGADAIHPGYGFLSENAEFARMVRKAGLIWIGPTPESIDAMALKVEAKRIAAAAGVPLVAGAELPAGQSDSDVVTACAAVGYPLLIKASAGGGGKGMRIVTSATELLEALQSARREAKSSFGDDTVFVERYLAGARHVEVQVFGDQYGNVVHLFERECSIQRRHQKVIEEAPSPGVTESVRERLHAAAVSLATEIGYVGAGTVEFMVFGSGVEQDFSFLEMNTRLQVEHPVTEEITGTDLVMWQIAVASGLPLPVAQDELVVRGHAIEARLYAEDPANDYLPATGLVHRFASTPRSGLRLDAGVADGSVITPHYDPMLAKVIAHAPTRELAASILSDGLARMTIHAPVTNRDSLVAVLRSAEFRSGDTTTAFLDEHPTLLAPALPEADEQRHALAVAYAIADANRPTDPIPLGWRNVPGAPQSVTMRRRGTSEYVTVLVDRRRDSDSVSLARTDDIPYAGVFATPAVEVASAHARVEAFESGLVVVVGVAGVTARCSVARYGDDVFVDDGQHATAWTVAPRFADHSLDAVGHGPSTSVPGTITVVAVAPGDAVTAGQTLVMLEAMKMEHRIIADHDGVVARVLVEVGQSVDAHTVVVEFAEDDPA